MAQTKFKMILKILVLLILFVLTLSRPAYADSTYVLPYPSFMPGSIFYKLNLVKEELMRFWYFGEFGQFSYNLKLSDKYLVESKTLFEYKQYLLGFKSLQKSDKFFMDTLPNLSLAEKSGKKIHLQRNILSQVSQRHIEVLNKLKKELPEKVTWSPEKGKPQILNVSLKIKESLTLRKKYLQ